MHGHFSTQAIPNSRWRSCIPPIRGGGVAHHRSYVAVKCVCSVHQQLVFPAMATSGPRYLHHVPLTYNCILDPATAAHAIVGQAAVAARDGTKIPIVATNDDVMNTPITQGWKLNNCALKFQRDKKG